MNEECQRADAVTAWRRTQPTGAEGQYSHEQDLFSNSCTYVIKFLRIAGRVVPINPRTPNVPFLVHFGFEIIAISFR